VSTLKIAVASVIAGCFIGYYGFGPKIITEERVKIIRDTRIIEHPDGTKETIIKDRIDTELVESVAKKDWLITAGMTINGDKEYQIAVHRQLIGDIYVGGFGSTTGSFGVSVGFSF